MTTQEIMEQIVVAQKRAQDAYRRHGLAMQAFQVACGRGDFALAQREQDEVLAAFESYMDEVQAIAQLNRQVE